MDAKKIQELIRIVEESGIAELEVHFWGGRKIVIRKRSLQNEPPRSSVIHVPQSAVQQAPLSTSHDASTPVQPITDEKLGEIAADDEEKYFKITSPMVGTFYRKPSPESQPYVDVGMHVVKGQTLCLIEAMKLFNEVKSEVSGTIKKILVADSSPVEYGQVLFLISPD